MRKKRVQSTARKAGGAARVKNGDLNLVRPSVTECLRFMGVSLSGGKSDKACIALLEFYPQQKKVFLSRLIEKIKAEEFTSADFKIHEIILQNENQIQSVAFDVPLSLPKCLTCVLQCPGYESCDEPDIAFIRKIYQQDQSKKKPKKMYTPYTQRCVDTYLLAHEPDLDPHHALGSNLAPLTARGIFISRRLKIPSLEVFPKLSVWRLGQDLKVAKSRLKSYRNSVGGVEAREIFLQAMTEQWSIFLYEQDRKTMIENFHAFDAFICAYSAYLAYCGKIEKRPPGLPDKEPWIVVPKSANVGNE